MSNNSDEESPTLKYMRYMRESEEKMQRAMARLSANPLFSTQLCPVVVTAANKVAQKENTQLSFDDLVKAASTEKQNCYHDWEIYRGFNFDDLMCLKCGETKPLDPSR